MAGFEDDVPYVPLNNTDYGHNAEGELVPNWSIRSTIKYPDPAPELTARAWANLRAERNARNAATEDDTEFDIVITQSAEEFDDPISTLAAYIKLAHQHGWEILSLAHSFAYAKGKPFKSGANEGQVRPDQHHETQWTHLRRDNDIVEVYVSIINEEPRGNLTVRRLNGLKIADRDLKNYIKGIRP